MAENRYNVDDILREVKENAPGRNGRLSRKSGPPPLRRTCCGSWMLLRPGCPGRRGQRRKDRHPPKTAPQPVKKAEPFPGELLQKTEAPAAPAPAAEPEFKWEEPKRQNR